MSIDNFFITNISKDLNHKEEIIEMLRSAKNITIISPFITKSGINTIFNNILEFKKVRIITELTPRGISSRSQSPKLLKEIAKKENVDIYFTTNSKLHSKIYVADETILITSANLTNGGLVNNFETGILFSKKSKGKFSDKMQTDILDRLNNGLIPYILKDAQFLNNDNITEWIDLEKTIHDKTKDFEAFIEGLEDNVPNNGFTPFSGTFNGRNITTQILASFKDFEFTENSWDVFTKYTDPSQISDLRNDLDSEINPMLKDIFHSVKQQANCAVHFTDLRDDIFSHNRQVSLFLPKYRNLYLTKLGLGGNNLKKHVYYPAFVLNMSVKDNNKIFQIRTGVEEDISTEPLCEHAIILLENLKKNSSNCIERFKDLKEDWFLIHGQDRQNKRKEIPLDEITKSQLEDICTFYLNSKEPADIAIGKNYYWQDGSILTRPRDFVKNLADDLNHLNYFFELAHNVK